MAMGSSKSPVARDERHAEALGEGDVDTVGDCVSEPQLVGPIGERLRAPESNRQGTKGCDRDEALVVADQLT